MTLRCYGWEGTGWKGPMDGQRDVDVEILFQFLAFLKFFDKNEIGNLEKLQKI